MSARILRDHEVRGPEALKLLAFSVSSDQEKPQLPESNWAFSGVMIANPRILDFVPAQRPAEIGFHLLPLLIGKMCARPIADFLLDIGTRESYKAPQTSWPGLKEVF